MKKITNCISEANMNSLARYLISISALLICCLNVTFTSCTSPNDHLNNDSINIPDSEKPIIDGTFIPYYLVSDWDDKRWALELTNLKKLGMHYLILSPTVYTDKSDKTRAIYPSSYAQPYYENDVVENCLSNASQFGFKVFLGLNSNEEWWSWWVDNTEDWLFKQMDFGNKIAKELTDKYKSRYKEAFYGWYWDWEIDNLNYTKSDRQQSLIKSLNINIDYLNSLTPQMPIMLSPFMNYKVGDNAYNYGNMWKTIFSGVHFRKGDIFCPQDCMGAGGLTLSNAGDWFFQLAEAVKTKPGLLFWSNAENFDQRFWTSATLDRFIQQLQIVKPYVSNYVSFTYSYYYSPFKVSKYFNEVYSYYVKEKALPQLLIPASVQNVQIYLDALNRINVSWIQPADLANIVGFLVYRDNELVANYQYDASQKCQTIYSESQKVPSGKHEYGICSYNANGECSPKYNVQYTVP